MLLQHVIQVTLSLSEMCLNLSSTMDDGRMDHDDQNLLVSS